MLYVLTQVSHDVAIAFLNAYVLFSVHLCQGTVLLLLLERIEMFVRALSGGY